MRTRRTRRSRVWGVAVLILTVVVAIIVFLYFTVGTDDDSKPDAKTNDTAITTNVSNANQLNANGASTEAEELAMYQNEEFGFRVGHPSAWEASENESGEGESRIVNVVLGTGDEGVTIIIVPTSMEGIIRESVSIVSETTTTMNGIAATELDARSAKDGTPLRLLFFTKGATLVVLNGASDRVERVGSTFTFLEQ